MKAMVLNERKMMEEHGSYHRSISGEEAERRLKACSDHCYLTRYSENRRCYMLTVYQKWPIPTTKHFEICLENLGDSKAYTIAGKTQEFKGIGALLHEYENSSIDPAFRTIGRQVTEAEYMSATSKCCTIL